MNFHEINKDFSLNTHYSPQKKNEKVLKFIIIKAKSKKKRKSEIIELKEKKHNIIDISKQNNIPSEICDSLSKSSLNFKHLFVLKKKTKSLKMIKNHLIL